MKAMHYLGRGFHGQELVDNGHSLAKLRHKVMFCWQRTSGDHRRQSAGHHCTLDRFEHPSSYAERGGEVWWSNGEESGRCNSDNSDHPWTVPALDIVSVVASRWNCYPIGTYRAFALHLDDERQKSHASKQLKH